VIARLQARNDGACLLRTNGMVRCWGVGTSFEEAAGKKLVGTPKPVDIAGLTDAVQIVVGAKQGCALRKGGAVSCWGYDGVTPDGQVLAGPTALPITGLGDVTRLVAMSYDLCAIRKDDRIVCFRLQGKPFEAPMVSPVKATEIVDAAGGLDHACIVARTGAVHCWGADITGPMTLGLDQDKKKHETFIRIADLDDATQIGASHGISCATRASGIARCWGHGDYIYAKFERGTDLPKVNDAVRVTMGRSHQCIVARDGHVRCVGSNSEGQLGVPGAWSGLRTVVDLDDAIEVAAGERHTCALRRNEDVVCWGQNTHGQIGDGTLEDRDDPTGVLGLGGVEKVPLPKPPPAPAFVLKLPKGARAKWREEESGSSSLHPDDFSRSSWFGRGGFEPSGVGKNVAVFAMSEDRAFAVAVDRGVIALAPPSGFTFLGADASDAIYAANKNGTIFRAADATSAMKSSGFVARATVAGAKLWDLAGDVIVAATSSEVHVSLDAGKTFVRRYPASVVAPITAIDNVLVRSDKVIAVHGTVGKEPTPTTMLSTDAGVTWSNSAFQPKFVFRLGASIYSNRCPEAVLSVDGKTWTKGTPRSLAAWGEALDKSSYPHWFTTDKLPGFFSPPPPVVPDAKYAVLGAEETCGGGGGGLAMAGGGRYWGAPGCKGVGCLRGLRGRSPGSTHTEVAFYSDGAIDDTKKLTRKPHVWVSSVAPPIDLPTGCEPVRILTAGGMGVLFCENDTSTHKVFAIGRDAKWLAEGTVPVFAMDDVTVSNDGTLVVHPICPIKDASIACAPALVRSPTALGTPTAWRSTTSKGALTYRALDGGQVLVVTLTPESLGAKKPDLTIFSLSVEVPGKPTQILFERVGVEGKLVDFELDDDKIRVAIVASKKRTSFWLSKTGGFIETK